MPTHSEIEQFASAVHVGETRAVRTSDAAESGRHLADEELWDLVSAEALTVLYERELGPFAHAAETDDAPVLAGGERPLANGPAEGARSGAGDRAGLENRLDAFEARVDTALQSVATRSELERLESTNGQLDALAAALQEARTQLERLPALEGRLGEVLALVSEERLAALLGTMRMPDSESIAASVARRLAERAPAAGGDDLARSIADFMDERRENDAQIAAMLDTMQQAMIRILDRIDAVEPGEADPLPGEPSPASRSEPAAPAIDVSRLSSATVGQSAPQDHGASRGEAAEYPETHASAPIPVAATPQGTRTTIDKIRQDLIADAQRAKMRVAAEAERARAAAAAAPAKIAGWGAERARAALIKNIPVNVPVKRLLVVALGLVVVIQAANLLLARRSVVPERPEASSAPNSAGEAAGVPADRAGASDRQPSESDAATPASGNASRRSSVEFPDSEPPRSAMVAGAMGEIGPDRIEVILDAQGTGSPGEDGADGNPPAAVPAALHPDASTAAPSAAEAVAPRAAKLLDLPPAAVGPLSLRLAAANGNPSAEFEVGARLAEGKGPSQDFKAAARWYQRSASRGFAQAQYRLGTLYERGLGVPADLARAGVWYRRAAEQGNITAMHNFAVLSAGSGGAAPDYTTAARWFLEAAERGLADSQFNLAVLHENGLGVPKDAQLAYKWFELAARSGDAEAGRRRDEAKARLSAADLATAGERASAWRAKPVDALANDARVAGEAWKKSGPEASG